MGDVVRVGWFVDDDGRPYLSRVTDDARKIEPNTRVTPEARKGMLEITRRVERARRQQA